MIAISLASHAMGKINCIIINRPYKTNCTYCLEHQGLEEGVCVNECSFGYYLNVTSRNCTPCHEVFLIVFNVIKLAELAMEIFPSGIHR